jgi:RNA polymerase sigma factor (TIGR02999 family)
MSDITALLQSAHGGDEEAAGRAVALLYDELRRQARSRLRRAGELTLLDTTALVHESYLRIRQAGLPHFEDRRHFLAYACKAMRHIVIDLARARQADRRGGAAVHVTLDTALGDSLPAPGEDVLRVHEALQELAEVDPRLGQVVEMRYFGGLSEPEIAECLGVTERTVQRDWKKARLFLSMSLR